MEFMEICPSTQPQPSCSLCNITVDWRFWPHHVDSNDHQIRARAHCPNWDENKRCCVIVIYCNWAAEPIPIIGYARRACGIEINDIILIPEQPEAAILEFFSVMDAFMFLQHSKESQICYKRDCFVTQAIPANNFSQIGWMNLFGCNYHEPSSTEAVMNNSINTDWPLSQPVPNYNKSVFDKLLEKASRKNWEVKEPRQHKRENRPGHPALYFYEIEINGKQYKSPDGGTTKAEGLLKLGAYCMNSIFNKGKNRKKKSDFPVLNRAKARNTRDNKTKGGKSLDASASPKTSKITITETTTNRAPSEVKVTSKSSKDKKNPSTADADTPPTIPQIKAPTPTKALPIKPRQISSKTVSEAGTHRQKINKVTKEKQPQSKSDNSECSMREANKKQLENKVVVQYKEEVKGQRDIHFHSVVKNTTEHNKKPNPDGEAERHVIYHLRNRNINNNKRGTLHLKSLPSTQPTTPSSTGTKSFADSVRASKIEKIPTSTATSSSSSITAVIAIANQPTISDTPTKKKLTSTLKTNHELKVSKPIRRKSSELTSVETIPPPKQPKLSLCENGDKNTCPKLISATSSSCNEDVISETQTAELVKESIEIHNEFDPQTEINGEIDENEITIVEVIPIDFDVDKEKDKVKEEKFSSPWPKVYLPKDYIKNLQNPVDVLEKVCLVYGWEKPCYQMQVTVSDSPAKNNNDRLSYKLILNGVEFRSEQNESSEQSAKQQIAIQCLIELAHHGAVPHPSVFINVALDPVKRLENLIISRGLAKNVNEPLYTTIQDLTDGGFYCEVVLNGVSYDPIDAGSRPCETEVEAKQIAVEYCLQKLSSSISLFADGSFTEKAKRSLASMSTEVSCIKNSNVSPAIFEKAEDLKLQCMKIKQLMRIPQNYLNGATEILRKLKHLFPHLQTKIFRNWYLRLYNYASEDELFIYIFDTAKADCTPLDLDSIKKHILGDPAGKQKFSGFALKNSGNTDVSSSSLSPSNIRSFVQNSNISSSNLPPFTLVTDPNCLSEVHLTRLIHYFSTFDPRTVPLLAVIRYWAKINKISFREPESIGSQVQAMAYDPAILDWLVINFLGGVGIIPTTRQLVERPQPFKFDVHKMWSHLDTPYAKEWRSKVDSYKRNSAEFWLSVLLLAKNFFTFYADRFDEGSRIINTYDTEILYCRDLLYGSFHTKLSPQWLDELVNEVRKRGTFKQEARQKLYMVLPKADVNWKEMITEMVEIYSARIFDQMKVTASRLDHFLKNFPDLDMDLCLLLKCYSISAN